MSVDHFLKALILQGDSHCLYYVRRARKESNCENYRVKCWEEFLLRDNEMGQE